MSPRCLNGAQPENLDLGYLGWLMPAKGHSGRSPDLRVQAHQDEVGQRLDRPRPELASVAKLRKSWPKATPQVRVLRRQPLWPVSMMCLAAWGGLTEPVHHQVARPRAVSSGTERTGDIGGAYDDGLGLHADAGSRRLNCVTISSTFETDGVRE